MKQIVDDIEIKDVNDFMIERKEQYECVLDINKRLNSGEKIIPVFGSLKIGKRELIECLSCMRRNSKIIFLTALNRNDMQDQMHEFRAYNKINENLEIFEITKSNSDRIISNFDSSKDYILMYDECDYGDNEGQRVEEFLSNYLNLDNVSLVECSGTPYSLMAAARHQKEFSYVKLPSSYQRLKYITKRHTISMPPTIRDESGKIIDLSDDFKNAINDWLKEIDNFPNFIVRDIEFCPIKDKNNDMNNFKVIFNKITGGKIDIEFINEKSSKTWNWKRNSWKDNRLIIVKETFTRGTETNIQNSLFGYYDNRSKSAMNTLNQALGRFACYFPDKKNNHINLYLSESGINLLNAYDYVEESIVINNDPIDQILNNLSSSFNIEKLSGNTKIDKSQKDYEWKIHWFESQDLINKYPCDSKSWDTKLRFALQKELNCNITLTHAANQKSEKSFRNFPLPALDHPVSMDKEILSILYNGCPMEVASRAYDFNYDLTNQKFKDRYELAELNFSKKFGKSKNELQGKVAVYEKVFKTTAHAVISNSSIQPLIIK